MRKLIAILLTLALFAGLAVPALAYNYSFSSGPDSGAAFGRSTGYDEPVTGDPLAANERRNKDAALLPPSYGVFSGDIPTDPSSLYHDNLPGGSSGGGVGSSGFGLPVLPSVPAITDIPQKTAPQYYSDGSIGTIYEEKTKKTIKVYQGETTSNMGKGAAHIASTSAWDGNCTLCGHNRGSAPYFSFVKDMSIGDKITFTTKYGARTYQVYRKEKIRETDMSVLGWSADNILTLLTCIAGVPELRWCVQLRAIG
jgi:sortase A